MFLVRKGAVWLAVLLLPFLLFALATNVVLLRSVGNPQTVKEVLKDSDIYANAVDGLLDATDNPNENGQGGIRSDNPVVRDAVKKAFTPALIQNSAESFIDSLYVWLEGKTPTPQFRIDLTEAKTTFVNEVAAGAQARAQSLPACPRGQTTFEDPFAATCLPRGVSPSVAADKIRQELDGGQEKFLKDPVITTETFKSKDGKPVFTSSSKLPENYQRIQKIPIVLGLLTLIALAAVIFLSESRAKGLRRAGVTLIIVGVSLLVITWLTNKVVNNQIAPKIKLESSVLQDNLRALVRNISSTVSRNYLIFGGVYTGLGATAIAGAIFIGRKRSPPVKDSATPPRPKSAAARPASSEPSPPKKG